MVSTARRCWMVVSPVTRSTTIGISTTRRSGPWTKTAAMPIRPNTSPAIATHQARRSERSSISARSTSQAPLASRAAVVCWSASSIGRRLRSGNAAARPGLSTALMGWFRSGEVVDDLAGAPEHLVLALTLSRARDSLFAVGHALQHLHLRNLVRDQRVLGADAGLDLLHRLLVGGQVDLAHQRVDLRQPAASGLHGVLQQALLLVGLRQRGLAGRAPGGGG